MASAIAPNNYRRAFRQAEQCRSSAFAFWMAFLLACSGIAGCKNGDAVSNPPSPGAGASTPGTIKVDLNMYTPGYVPAGIGEPVHAAADVAAEWEKMHPGKRIEFQLVVVTGSGEGEWLMTQLLAGIAPEIIHQNAEIAWPDIDKGWYVPLDEFLERPNPYTPGNKRWIESFRNQDLVNAKRAPDGKLYCISIDIVETGLFYNKTLLNELDISRREPPETWSEMMEMFKEIDAQGVTPLIATQLGLTSDWGEDVIFEMLYHDILPEMDLIPSRKEAVGYLGNYLEAREAAFLFTKGFFTRRDPRWRELFRILYEWRQYWSAELKKPDPLRQFLTGRGVFYWESSFFIRRMATDPFVDFDWGVTYLPTITRACSPYGSGTPANVIGGAAIQLHVTNSALRNKNLEDCIDFLMYLSAPRSIERITSEALVFIPNIKGARMSEELKPFAEIFKRPYCAIKWLETLDVKYKKYWRRMMDFYLNDGFSDDEDENIEGFVRALEHNFAAWVDSHHDDELWDFDAMEKVWKEREARLIRELDSSN